MPKILLVEDNELNRDMLSRRLERRGFEVLLAVDGSEGLTRARAEIPDLILMDMSLPIMDGWEATRQLKADEATRIIPVIALTAHAMSGDREKAIEAGCDDYDVKPVELDRLVGKMEALLSTRPPAAIDQESRLRTLRHDSRTLVNHIAGYAELLQEEASDAGRTSVVADLRNIVDACRDILEFITTAMTVDGANEGRLTPGRVHQAVRLPVHAIIAYDELLRDEAADNGWNEALPDLNRMAHACWELLGLLGRELNLELSPREQYETTRGDLASPEARAAKPAAAASATVLVIDDNPMNREILRRRLERLGYGVDLASGGHAGLAAIAQREHAAVLLDLHMPPPSGYDVLRTIKADATLRHIPVIVVSATDSEDSVRTCTELGAAGYLVTPVQPDQLGAQLAKIQQASA